MDNVFEGYGKTVEDALTVACEAAGVGLDEVEYEILEMPSRGFLGLGGKLARVQITLHKSVQIAKKAQQEKLKQKKSVKEVTSGQQSEQKRQEKTPYKKEKATSQTKVVQNKSEVISQVKEKVKKNQTVTKVEKTIEPFGKFITSEQEAVAFLQPVFIKMQIDPTYIACVKEDILWISFSGTNLGALIGRRGETLNSLQYLTNLIINRGKEEHCRIVLDVEGYRQSREKTLCLLAKRMADQAVRSGRRLELEPMNPHERRIVHLALQEDKRVDTLSYGEEPYRRVVIVKKRHHQN